MDDVRNLYDYPVTDERWIDTDMQDLAEWAHRASMELLRLRASHEAIRAEIPQLEDLAGEPAYGLPIASAAARRVVAAWRAAEPK